MLYLAVLAVSFLLGPIFLRLDRTFIAAFLGAVLLPPLVVLAATRGILQSIIPVLLSLLLASRLVVGAVLCSLPFLAAALLLLLCFHRKVMSNLFAICLMAPAFAAATWFFLDAMFLSRLATHGLVFDPGATALSRCCLVYICTAFTAFEFHRMAHST